MSLLESLEEELSGFLIFLANDYPEPVPSMLFFHSAPARFIHGSGTIRTNCTSDKPPSRATLRGRECRANCCGASISEKCQGNKRKNV